MKILKFCPDCGEPSLQFSKNKWICQECAFTLYHNVAAACAAVIRCGEEILFTVRNKEPKKNFLDLPGGFIDAEETAEQAVCREISEELQWNLPQVSLEYCGSEPNDYHYKEIDYKTLDLFYQCILEEKPEFRLQEEEISAVKWVKISDLKMGDLAFRSQQNFLKKFFRLS